MKHVEPRKQSQLPGGLQAGAAAAGRQRDETRRVRRGKIHCKARVEVLEEATTTKEVRIFTGAKSYMRACVRAHK